MELQEPRFSRRLLLAGTGMAVAATGLRHAGAGTRGRRDTAIGSARRRAGDAWRARLTMDVAGTAVVADGVALLRPGTTVPHAFAMTARTRRGRPAEYVTYGADGALLLRRGAAAADALTVAWGAAYRGTGDTSTVEVPFRTAAGTGRVTLLAALPASDAERLAAVMALGSALSPTRARQTR